jgi:hypothetical protein
MGLVEHHEIFAHHVRTFGLTVLRGKEAGGEREESSTPAPVTS